MYLIKDGALMTSTTPLFTADNRAFRYGDSVFESIRFSGDQLLFYSDHFARLKLGIRMMKMVPKKSFNANEIEAQIRTLILKNDLSNASVRVQVFRKGGGKYSPKTNEISYVIQCAQLSQKKYELNKKGLNIEVYTDLRKSFSPFSSFKSGNSLCSVMGSVFAKENGLDDVLLINSKGGIAEASASNIFLRFGEKIITPSLQEACIDGVMRKNIIQILREKKMAVTEKVITISLVQKADELFLTNAIQGVQWVKNFRSKKFTKSLSLKLISELNHQFNY